MASACATRRGCTANARISGGGLSDQRQSGHLLQKKNALSLAAPSVSSVLS